MGSLEPGSVQVDAVPTLRKDWPTDSEMDERHCQRL